MSTPVTPTLRRQLYMVLSARSLPYAEKGIESLFAHALEDLSLTLITDGPEDKRQILAAVAGLANPRGHQWQVYEQAEADQRADTLLADYPHLRGFRHGHPCWRKLTDPLLFAEPGAEMIVLDPDLYFPNLFTFETTPERGLLLMWQPPSCLLPDEVVRRAYEIPVQLAHHVDIGVAHVRNHLDLAWFDAFIGQLGGPALPRVMHVEAIIWAALAMRMGGRYLDPAHWHCWQNRQWKRVARKLGTPGVKQLQQEDFSQVKCFHAGGVAKWWVKEACEQNLFPAPKRVDRLSQGPAFEALSPSTYKLDQGIKRVARSLGYYALFKPAT